MIFMAYNNELKKRYIPLIGIMSIYLLVLIRDINVVNISIGVLTALCIVLIPFLDNSELIGFGMSMVVYNHALQINYILMGIVAFLIIKNLKSLKTIKKSALVLSLIIIFELFHALGMNTIDYSMEAYLRWLCMPLFLAFLITIPKKDNKKILDIYVFATLLGMINIYFQYINYEGGSIINVLTSRFRFGNTYLYNNDLKYCLYDNSNNIAFYALAAIVSCMVIYETTYLKRYLYLIIVFLLFGFLTQSRTFLASCIILLLCKVGTIFQNRNKGINKKAMGFIFSGFIILCILTYCGREYLEVMFVNISKRFSSGDFSKDRGTLLTQYVNYCFSNLNVLFGGIGTQNVDKITGIENTTHNGIVDILICFGLPGIALMIVHWFIVIKDACKKKLEWFHYAAFLAFFIEYMNLQYVRVPALFGISSILYIILNMSTKKLRYKNIR